MFRNFNMQGSQIRPGIFEHDALMKTGTIGGRSFKFGFVGVLTVPLPSPAEKGDREAVDEESICNPTYWGYSYVSTTIRIKTAKWLIQLYF